MISISLWYFNFNLFFEYETIETHARALKCSNRNESNEKGCNLIWLFAKTVHRTLLIKKPQTNLLTTYCIDKIFQKQLDPEPVDYQNVIHDQHKKWNIFKYHEVDWVWIGLLLYIGTFIPDWPRIYIGKARCFSD